MQELAHSHIKQEVVRLHGTLSELEAKREAKEAEHKSLGSPQEERDKLFKQVRPQVKTGIDNKVSIGPILAAFIQNTVKTILTKWRWAPHNYINFKQTKQYNLINWIQTEW